jgi:hypothetical protein
MPAVHRRFLAAALPVFGGDERLLGLAAGGSFIAGELDEHSDLDLVVFVRSDRWQEVLAERASLAAELGPLLAAFTGEHVGEPRLLICLYGPPLLHVDLKFVSVDDPGHRVEDPVLLWDRTGAAAESLAASDGRYPQPHLQWIEDRFWVWVHYGAVKIARGELFEALGFLAFLRGTVLGPLCLAGGGMQPNGVRRLESLFPDHEEALRATVGAYEARSCARALRAAVDLYRELRRAQADEGLVRGKSAEEAACRYPAELEGSCDRQSGGQAG